MTYTYVCLGWLHEQSRHDRDDYVNVNYYKEKCNNVNYYKEKYEESMFGKKKYTQKGMNDKATSGTHYDFASIMHYPINGKCISWNKEYDNHGNHWDVTNSKNKRLSKIDIEEINAVYYDKTWSPPQWGRNSFWKAAEEGNIAEMFYLNLLDPEMKNVKDVTGDTVLTMLAEKADVSIVKLLIENYNMNPQEKGGYNRRNAFMKAALWGKIETLEYLDSIDPDLKNDKDGNGDTALTIAARQADVTTVKTLIETYNMKPQDKGYYGRNAFLTAAGGGNIEVMKYLNSLDAGLKNDKDNAGNNALTMAGWVSGIDKYTVVKFLVGELGMKPQKRSQHGRSAFQQASASGEIDVMKYLNGIDPDLKYEKDNYGDNALTLAAWTSGINTVKFLVEDLKMNVHVKGAGGRNALEQAKAGKKYDVVEYLSNI